ncbi:MAG: ribonuclease HII [Patescibacteria group bacterium]
MQKPTQKIELDLVKQYQIVAGVDEAGRGPLAGPVTVGAVIFNPNSKLKNIGIADSKLLSDEKRRQLFEIITAEFDWGVGVVSSELIDQHGISWAVSEGLNLAVKNLKTKPEYLVLDGRIKLPADLKILSQEFIKGDRRIFSIAAASIIAKVWRDSLMLEYDQQFPQYNFAKHKGYGTREHYALIQKYGPCQIHRRCYDLHLG